jgi:asparagine synthase (glutamine-hydrolysing)
MCGIVGYYKTNNTFINSTKYISNMLIAQKHRGPDDSGIMAFNLKSSTAKEYPHQQIQHVDEPFNGILGFNRLSILDLSKNGHQPMCSPDGQVILTMNGEIYNAFDLKPALEADGCIFKSTTDTEVVLYLYLKYGIKGLLQKLNGMFAIAVIDLRESTIYVARDRFGIKPMYYYLQNGVFAFSSELKCFLQLDEFKPELQVDMLDEYLLYRNTLHHTLLKNVHIIEPGQYISYDVHNQFTATQYFDINNYSRNANTTSTLQQEIENVKATLTASVASQLMSDVKLGCQLSGGIDSSLVTYLAKEIQQNDLLESVSIVFDNKQFSEKPFIDKVANQLHIISHQFPLQSNYYLQQIEKATWHFEQPINHPNTIGIYLLAQKAKHYVTVLLSGEGADEVFGGYSRFYSVMYPYTSKQFWAGLKNAGIQAFTYLKHYANPFNRANINIAQMTTAMATALKSDFNYEKATAKRRTIYNKLTGSNFDKQVKYDMSTYLPDLLIRQDKMSMAHSIENRVPFLDNDVVEKSFNIPEKYLVKKKTFKEKNTEKYIVKKLCGQVFGDDFAFRDKMGFGIPLREFMAKPDFYTYLHDVLLPSMKKRNVLNTNKIEHWIKNIANISAKELDALWVVVSLEIWLKQFIDFEK